MSQERARQLRKDMTDDDRRTAWLADQGFAVLRFWNHEVLTETEAVVQDIADALGPPTRPA